MSISPAGRGQLVKMLTTLDPLVYLDHNVHTYLFKHCPATGMQNSDEATPSIISEGRGLLVKMLITLEQHGIS